MDRTVFDEFRQMIYERCGIALREGKEALLAARVGRRLKALGLDDYRTYFHCVQEDGSGHELTLLLDAITTNVTGFYREPEHFAFLADRVVAWLSRGQRRFRFWSAACATGEEPYSLAAALLTAVAGADVDLRILATDISTRALDAARRGLYAMDKMKTVPLEILRRYFHEMEDGDIRYRVGDALKSRVTFARLNLAAPPFPMQGPFDAVLCRNVMIYFDNPVRGRLLEAIHRLVKPGGYLLVGHAEGLTGMMSDFEPVKPSVYVKTARPR
jgi:chemotaxis protein methyltransferase CheR